MFCFLFSEKTTDFYVVVAEHDRSGINLERETLTVDRIIMHERYDEG